MVTCLIIMLEDILMHHRSGRQ